MEQEEGKGEENEEEERDEVKNREIKEGTELGEGEKKTVRLECATSDYARSEG